MKTSTATNKGIFLGKGIFPFPDMFAFSTNKNASNLAFLSSLDGVVEIPQEEMETTMNLVEQAKQEFFERFPNHNLD